MVSKVSNYFGHLGAVIFYLFIFLLPWQTRWIFQPQEIGGVFWEYGSLALYFTDALFFLLVLVTLVYFFLSASAAVPPSFLRSQGILFIFLLFLSLSLLSLFWSLDQNLAFYFWLRLVGAFLLLTVTLILPLKKFWLFGSFIAAGLVQAGLAIWQFIGQRVPANKYLGIALQEPSRLGAAVVEMDGRRILRAYGSLPHPNILAGFLLLALVVAIIWFLTNKSKSLWPQLFFGISLGLITLALLLTLAKSAWLILGLLLLGWLIYVLRRKPVWRQRYFLVLFIIGAVVLNCWQIKPELFFARWQLANRLEQKSLTERLQSYRQAQEVLATSWFRGVGLGNYTLTLAQQSAEVRPAWEYQPVHNSYLLLASETSIFGLALFGLLLGQILALNWPWGQTAEPTWLMVVVALLALGLFDHYFFSLAYGWWFFWLVIAINLKLIPTHE